MSGHLFIAITVVLNAASQLLMKYGVDQATSNAGSVKSFFSVGLSVFTNPFVLLGLFTMTISMATHLIALSKFDVGYVFPFISFAYIIVAIAGVIFLNEQVDIYRATGIVIIIIGVIVLAQGQGKS